MKKPTTAQQIYMLFGLSLSRLLIYGGKRQSATKKGPGRRHKDGYKKD